MATKTLDDMMTTLPLPKGGKRLNFDDDVKPLPNPKPTKATDLGKYATPLKNLEQMKVQIKHLLKRTCAKILKT